MTAGGAGALRGLLFPLLLASQVSCAASSQVALRQWTPHDWSRIKHVVIVVQENRSFDNLFHGFPGADWVDSGLTHTGRRVPLSPISLKVRYDISHGYQDFRRSYDRGKMDGFDRASIGPKGQQPPGRWVGPYPQYGYVPAAESRPYFDLAHQYVLADRMFQSNVDQSFAAHLYLISAQAGGAVNNPLGRPWGCDAPRSSRVIILGPPQKKRRAVFPCFSFRTLADELDEKGTSWRYYAPRVDPSSTWLRFLHRTRSKWLYPGPPNPDFGQLWSAFDAIAQVRYGADWDDNVSAPETSIFADIAHGDLADVSWVIPNFRNSDHTLSLSDSGPSWVMSVVNALGSSKYWADTAIVVTWDDSGGWYDHVPPPQLDFDGLGNRVPLVVVSPFAKRGHVSHVQYETSSIVKFVESVFGLPTLSASDRRAANLDDCFDLAGPARAFKTVRAPYGASSVTKFSATSGISFED